MRQHGLLDVEIGDKGRDGCVDALDFLDQQETLGMELVCPQGYRCLRVWQVGQDQATVDEFEGSFWERAGGDVVEVE